MKNLSPNLFVIFALMTVSLLNQAIAAPEDFTTGPVFENYGENATIKGGLNQPETQQLKVVFDVYKENEGEAPHRGFNSIARFINMHVRAGMPRKNIEVALVVHGKASYQLMTTEAFAKKFEKENPSADLVTQLHDNDVKIFVCGQTVSHLGLEPNQLNENVQMSLSAMTANALLQQQGYTLNPF